MKNVVFYLTIVSLGAGGLFANASSVLAINYPPQNNGIGKTTVVRAQTKTVGIGKTLGGPNLNSCLARQSAIKTQMSSLVNLSTRMERQFDLIAQRAVDNYNAVVVPSGKIVPNYNALISDVQTKKETVQSALTIAQTESNNFSCTSEDPKLLMTQFRLNMQMVKVGLKSYRLSIKNLITTLRTVSSEPINKVENNQ